MAANELLKLVKYSDTMYDGSFLTADTKSHPVPASENKSLNLLLPATFFLEIRPVFNENLISEMSILQAAFVFCRFVFWIYKMFVYFFLVDFFRPLVSSTN